MEEMLGAALPTKAPAEATSVPVSVPSDGVALQTSVSPRVNAEAGSAAEVPTTVEPTVQR